METKVTYPHGQRNLGFIPKDYTVYDQDGGIRTVKYINVRRLWSDGSIGIDNYYDRNISVFHRLSVNDLEKIPGFEDYKTGKANLNLYRSVFPI